MEEKAKNTPEKKKKPFMSMEIAKVPLNQDQAVLSCCERTERGMVDIYQCDWQLDCGPEPSVEDIAS